MDQQGHGHPQETGLVPSSSHMPYSSTAYEATQMMRPPTAASVGSIQPPQTAGLPPLFYFFCFYSKQLRM